MKDKSAKKSKKRSSEETLREEDVDTNNSNNNLKTSNDDNINNINDEFTVKIIEKKKKIKLSNDNTELPNEIVETDEEINLSNTQSNESNNVVMISNSIFSNEKFSDLPITEPVKNALTQLGFEKMTMIQSKAIPQCLSGNDVVGAAKTGSGKTLAFLIPIIELLNKVQFTRKQGTGALVISPTRELSLQIYGVLKDLMEHTGFPQTHGLIMGGANRKAELDKLSKGVNIVVATPGRLLDHLANSPSFNFQRLLILVIDEADRILEQGFEEDMHQIIKILPKERQTVLFSATQTRKVEDLARLSIRGTPIYIGVHDNSEKATVDGLQQGYVVCPAENRFMLLYTFLKKNKNKKIMVFFSSCNSVKFHSELLNYIDIEVLDIHGKQKQQKRTTTFFQFCKSQTGILLCTDVAARGLDIPAVDWIVQYDPPDDPKEYIHRVGRTARGTSTLGRALLFLLPEETNFLKYLRLSKVVLQEYEFPMSKIININTQLNLLIEKNYYLNKSARDAYRSYLLSYASHSHKDIFNVHEIDLAGVGKAFGFIVPPRIDLNFNLRTDKRKSNKSKVEDSSNKKDHYKSSGHVFSADNPYGKRDANDKRQFAKF